ncbi:metallo-beta-lactamase domain protein (macronuclear) [Tetrahymena thermophila SB210]|uniref:Metallo-beta-lactamase domain protein n=1 Tax=Tetrahymena thermophila (strain SB210) TaxID=312017 RepID=W7X017_TETTS|nr:metallo-beta-lactamase domain protein [Tetrahymena thermophila SB210]EWS71212.1 metallo-beta-lactamase domain protein [Tetrahymena thermophila SB210]|eukprot:XP_012656265.1 metallo-beta-lactamase domain protein [Tetrahymena thermophila SB210]
MLPQINKIERLSKKVWRILGLNPGPFTLQGTNTYLIGEGKYRTLIDCGQNEDGYKELLKQVLDETQSQISQVIFTHNHPDHTLGIKDILELKQNCTFKKYMYLEEDQQLEQEYGFKYEQVGFQDMEIVKGEDHTLQVITTPGHCTDHVCFYLFEEKTLFTGDFILSGSSNVIRNLKDQMNSFKKCLSLDVENIYSAHGVAITGKEESQKTMLEQMQHRQMREDKIKAAIKQLGQCNSNQILEIVYPGLQENLVNGALHNISVHITKLIDDKLVLKLDNQQFKWVEEPSL